MNKTLFKAQTQSHPYHQSPWPSLSSSPSPSSSLYIAHHIHHHHHQLPHQSSKKTFLTFDNHHQHTYDICQFFYTSVYQTKVKIYPQKCVNLGILDPKRRQFMHPNSKHLRYQTLPIATQMSLKLHWQSFPHKKFYPKLKWNNFTQALIVVLLTNIMSAYVSHFLFSSTLAATTRPCLKTNSLICLPINWYKTSLVLLSIQSLGEQGHLGLLESPLQNLKFQDNLTKRTGVLLTQFCISLCFIILIIKTPVQILHR